MKIDKDNIKIILILLIVGLGIGYSYLNTNLNINGTANINSASWNVHWANVQVSQGSVSANTPTISNNTTVNYTVTLTQPGDYYEFTVDAVNSGTIDAMIDTISSKLNGVTITTLPAYLEYRVTYSDGLELQTNHELLHDTTETYKVRIGYKSDINASELPSTNQSLSLQFTVGYKQATPEAIEVEHAVFGFGQLRLGDNITNNPNVYQTYQEVLNATGHKPFHKFVIKNNLITKISVGVVHNGEPFYLIGGGATHKQSGNEYDYNNDSIYYEINKATLINEFGSANCSETSYDTDGYLIVCSDSQTQARSQTDGFVSVFPQNDSGWYCNVYQPGYSLCFND